MEHNTWSLADLPDDRKQVGSKWVFKVKRDQNGDIDRFKCTGWKRHTPWLLQ